MSKRVSFDALEKLSELSEDEPYEVGKGIAVLMDTLRAMLNNPEAGGTIIEILENFEFPEQATDKLPVGWKLTRQIPEDDDDPLWLREVAPPAAGWHLPYARAPESDGRKEGRTGREGR